METFEVQVVRSGARGLQALRRSMTISVGDRGLKVFAGETNAPVLNIARTRVNSVRVRGRLIRVVLEIGQALTIRLNDEEEVLRAAELMMESWDIDPLVESSEMPAAATEEEDADVMTAVAEHYMTSSTFRRLVHEMHDHIDGILDDSQSSYTANV